MFAFAIKYPTQEADSVVLQPVGIQDSLKMVDFVLEYHGCESFHSVADCPLGVSYIRVFDDDFPRSHYLLPPVRNRQATFGSCRQRVGGPDDPYVRIDFERFARFVESLHGHDALVDAYLRSRKADSFLGRMGDGAEHQAAKIHEVVGTDGPRGKVGAFGAEHCQVQTVLDREDPEYAVCAPDELALLSREPSFALVRNVAPECDEQGYGEYQE